MKDTSKQPLNLKMISILHQPPGIFMWLFLAGLASVTVTATDMINLTSTITNENHTLWPEMEVNFTCETRGLVLEWTSDDYIGEGGIALEFSVFIDNLGDTRTLDLTQTGSMAILTSVDHMMASQLRIKTSSGFPTSSVTCTNFNGTSQTIMFSVLACSPPTQDGILIPPIPNTQRDGLVTFTCKEGYNTSEELTAQCLCNGTWTVDPNDVICTDIDECNGTTICPENSQCINTNGSYTCVCNEGYFHLQTESLSKCEDVDECTFSGMNTCDNSSRADCMNTPGNYTCTCKEGYKGDGRTCHSFDETTCDTLCEHHCVISTSEEQRPRCACNRGFYLAPDGITCIDINECHVPDYEHFCANGRCTNTIGSYECICDSGFINDGSTNCLDQDECQDASLNNCDENANCTNNQGSYDCICKEDFYGDGFSCERGISPKINRTSIPVKPNHELKYNVGTDFCVEDPMSTSFSSSIICQLEQNPIPPPEFVWNVTLNGTDLELPSDNLNGTLNLTGPITLDNTSTLDVICHVSNRFGSDTANTSIRLCGPTECQDGVTNNCTQKCTRYRYANTGVYNCSCYPGYSISTDDSTSCHDIDECTSGDHNCNLQSNQICQNKMPPEQFSCECKIGYRYAGENCSDINECEEDSYNCPPSSICVNTVGSFDCMCVNKTQMDENENCTDIDECSKGTHSCSKYANCKNSYGGYSCECHIGFTGDGENCTISREVIIGTSVTAGLLLGGIFLLLITTGSVKIGRRFRTFVQQKVKQRRENAHHEMNMIHGSVAEENKDLDSSTAPERYMVVRGSIKSKLPPTLIIKSTNLRVLDPIGQGEFGIVYKGCLTGQYTDEIVAIKTLKGFIDDGAVQELLSECAKMRNFDNLHVMSLKGVCLDGGPVPYIILPYMANGSLASYLRKQRKDLVVMKETTSTTSNIESDPQSQVLFVRKRLMDMCLQVAKGMEYLASEKVVHRDLAARNCMIDINMVIKVADFGLSVNIGAKEYYRLTRHMDIKLPVKWMAPESLADYMFSEMSDVWSYGVTCWEIFTGGQAPYAGVRSSALLSYLQQGERLAMPNNSACNDDLYSMMQWCWEMEPDERPSFSILVNTLSKSLENQAGYLRVGAFTDNPDSSIDQKRASLDQEL